MLEAGQSLALIEAPVETEALLFRPSTAAGRALERAVRPLTVRPGPDPDTIILTLDGRDRVLEWQNSIQNAYIGNEADSSTTLIQLAASQSGETSTHLLTISDPVGTLADSTFGGIIIGAPTPVSDISSQTEELRFSGTVHVTVVAADASVLEVATGTAMLSADLPNQQISGQFDIASNGQGISDNTVRFDEVQIVGSTFSGVPTLEGTAYGLSTIQETVSGQFYEPDGMAVGGSITADGLIEGSFTTRGYLSGVFLADQD